MSLRHRWVYIYRRVREALLRRSYFRSLQFRLNEREMAASERLGAEHIGQIPCVGVRMIIHPKMYLKSAYVSALFEAPAVFFIRDWLRTGDTFVDVGANVGIFSLLGASCVGPGGRVIAFEPGRFTFALLERNCRLNKFTWVQCEKLALGRTEKDILLSEGEPGFDVYTSVGRIVHPSAQSGQFALVSVRQSAGDDWGKNFERGGIRLMKIDVEGAELGVIQGFAKTLVKGAVDAVLIEITEDMSEACGSSPTEIWEAMEKFGYSWWILGNYGAVTPATGFTKRQTMYVAFRRGIDPVQR